VQLLVTLLHGFTTSALISLRDFGGVALPHAPLQLADVRAQLGGRQTDRLAAPAPPRLAAPAPPPQLPSRGRPGPSTRRAGTPPQQQLVVHNRVKQRRLHQHGTQSPAAAPPPPAAPLREEPAQAVGAALLSPCALLCFSACRSVRTSVILARPLGEWPVQLVAVQDLQGCARLGAALAVAAVQFLDCLCRQAEVLEGCEALLGREQCVHCARGLVQ
jgi:hypothetical protein